MALKKDFKEERFNATINDAYMKLCYLSWSDVNHKMTATISVWATPTAEAEGLEAVSCIELDVTDLWPTLQQDIYNAVKIEPQFMGSTDV